MVHAIEDGKREISEENLDELAARLRERGALDED